MNIFKISAIFIVLGLIAAMFINLNAKNSTSSENIVIPKSLHSYVLTPPFPVSKYSKRYIPKTSGLKKYKITIKQQRRSFYTYTPNGMEKDKKYPAILLLHGNGRSGISMADTWRRVAQTNKIKLIAPNAAEGHKWLYEDELEFIRYLINMLKNDSQIDQNNIYIFGHSSGGIAAINFGAMFSESIRAAAAHAGKIVNQDDINIIKDAKIKIPMCLFIGSKDPYFSVQMVKETAELLSTWGHNIVFIEIDGHNHWYYTLANWINNKAWQCMTHTPKL